MCDSVCHPSTDLYLWRVLPLFTYLTERLGCFFFTQARCVWLTPVIQGYQSSCLSFPGSDLRLLLQRSHITSPNLQRCQLSPSFYFRGSVCRLPGFENFSCSLLVVSQNSRGPPPNCWSGPECRSPSFKKKKKKKTSRNARFLEWLSPRMRQHSHGRESCTCRLLPQFLFRRRIDCSRSGFGGLVIL